MNNPYSAPKADMSHAVECADTYDPDMFSFTGRIGRCRYLAYSLGLTLILFVSAIIIGAVAGSANPFYQPIFWYLPAALITFAMAVRRLNDMQRPGWWSLLLLIPVVNLGVFLWLMFGPGDHDANRYGPPPGPNTWLVIAGACLMPVLMAVMINMLASVLIMAYRASREKTVAAQQDETPAPPRALPMAQP